MARTLSGEVFSLLAHPYFLPPEAKAEALVAELELYNERWGMPRILVVTIGRSTAFDDFFPYIAKYSQINNQFLWVRESMRPLVRRKVSVSFDGEDGVDAGGLRRELFECLIHDMLLRYQEFFVPLEGQHGFYLRRIGEVDADDNMEDSEDGSNALSELRGKKSPDSSENQRRVYYQFGIILGMALYNRVMVPDLFSPLLYKALVGDDLYPTDVEELDPQFYSSLCSLRALSPASLEALDLRTRSGERVLQANLEPYIEEQMRSRICIDEACMVRTGFFLVCKSYTILSMTPEDLQLALCGAPVLDFAALFAGAIYTPPNARDEPCVRWLQEAIEALPQDEQRGFLRFVTGSSRAPIRGLGTLHMRIVLGASTESSRPAPMRSHTCVNQLYLPKYQSKTEVAEGLRQALDNSVGFGFI